MCEWMNQSVSENIERQLYNTNWMKSVVKCDCLEWESVRMVSDSRLEKERLERVKNVKNLIRRGT